MMELRSRTASNPLIILDLANNHDGSVPHAKKIISELARACSQSKLQVVVKFQYRDLDTFIHEDFKERFDLKYVKRFQSTRLEWDQFEELTAFSKDLGFLTSATPFDENSVLKVVEHGHDILKVASASFTDWPLWEAIAQTSLPIVASTAGATIEKIDRVVAFLENRDRDFALMHCVAAYPTSDEDLNLNRIDTLRGRYSPIPVGYSTHEDPRNLGAGGLALAKGAAILERHVGVPSEVAELNGYSSDPDLIAEWLENIERTIVMCGDSGNAQVNPDEVAALKGLSRGVYFRDSVEPASGAIASSVFFAIPLQDGQISANEWSKYLEVTTCEKAQAGEPVMWSKVESQDRNQQVLAAVRAVSEVLVASGVTYPVNVDLELSHHYGLDSFNEFGLAMLTVVNREYCKKLLVVLPGQQHPEQYHNEKEESFHLLHGTLDLWLDGAHQQILPGSVVVVQRGVRHRFSSANGAVLEEISSTHHVNDSFYVDPAINENQSRKSFVKYWGNA